MGTKLRWVVSSALVVACGGGGGSSATTTTSGGCEPPDCVVNPGPCDFEPNQPGCPGYEAPEGSESEPEGEAEEPRGVPLPE
ncbi:MAG: hypothetical protein KF901_20925 [Myxococcales bacterium]|nr:hypothetical protein [Myxococcales bacterium]